MSRVPERDGVRESRAPGMTKKTYSSFPRFFAFLPLGFFLARYSFFGATAAYGGMRSEGKLPIISPEFRKPTDGRTIIVFFPRIKKETFLCGDPSAQRSSLPRGRFFFSKLEEEEEGDDRDSLSVLLLLVFQTLWQIEMPGHDIRAARPVVI